MIEPAMFAFIRDGDTTLYCDPCGSALFVRNLVWGPDELESWLAAQAPVSHFPEDCAAGAVVDFDAKALLWWADDEGLELPKANALFSRLVETAWSGYEILIATEGVDDLRAASGHRPRAEDQELAEYDDEYDDDVLADRLETIEEDLEYHEDFDDEEEEEAEWRAWISILDEDNVIHHRTLSELTQDVIQNRRNVLNRLREKVEPSDIPAELTVREGILFDQPAKKLRFWGGRNAGQLQQPLEEAWPDWDVQRVPADGYEFQCQFSGPTGTPASDAEALGSVVPMLLFTKRIDAAMMIGQIGKAFKGFIAKLVGFLTFLVCLPFLIFALVTGNWRGAGITIAIIVGLVVIAFKLIEYRWKRGFSESIAASPMKPQETEGGQPVAGPMDDRQRRKRIDELLSRAGLPSISQIEPHFDNDFMGLG